jgi:hypothetical protein
VQDLRRERPAVADLEREQVSVDRDHEPDPFERRDLRMRVVKLFAPSAGIVTAS